MLIIIFIIIIIIIAVVSDMVCVGGKRMHLFLVMTNHMEITLLGLF